MKRTSSFLTLAVALALPFCVSADSDDHHVMASLVEIDGSGVQGMVNVVKVPGGAMIGVAAFGPTPGATYVSLYYSSRDCTLGGDSGIVGSETYDANASGVGRVQGVVDEGVYTINSVSVRDASDFRLLACAQVGPAD